MRYRNEKDKTPPNTAAYGANVAVAEGVVSSGFFVSVEGGGAGAAVDIYIFDSDFRNLGSIQTWRKETTPFWKQFAILPRLTVRFSI